jgi:N-acetylneuraminic acid mutarotase
MLLLYPAVNLIYPDGFFHTRYKYFYRIKETTYMRSKNAFALCLCCMILFSATACDTEHTNSIRSQSTLSSATENNVSSNDSKISSTSPLDSQPVHDQWISMASMHTPRYDFGMETVNGKIYVIGGNGKDGDLNSVEEYDIKTDQWSIKGPMPTARSNLQTVLLDGKIYAIGGIIGIQSSNAVERYDPAADKWIQLSPLNYSREYFKAVAFDGKIYVFGGSDGGTLTSSVEEYNPSTNTWTEKSPMPVPKMHFQTEVINGKIYIIGGLNPVDGVGPAVNTTSVEVYDPVKNEWTQKSPMKTPRFSFQTEIVEGKIYAMGGINDQVNALSSVEVYDPSIDRWSSKKDMNLARSWFQTAVVNGKIIAIGGTKKAGDYSEGNFLSSVEEYNPKTNTWTEKSSLLTPRGFFQSAIVDGRLYVLGGTEGSSNNDCQEPGLATIEAYHYQ